MNKPSIEAAARAVKKGVVVVRSSRVPMGAVGRNVEIDDDKLGFIASDELNPQKSRVLLSLALLSKRSPEQIQQLFYMY
jgi:L-asparaginase